MKGLVLHSRLLMVLAFSALVSGPLIAQEAFHVELGRDGETLGDMRPVFLEFESRPLPAISPAEVARRYRQLFDRSDDPGVRIDALNRLNNIRDRAGEDIGFNDQQELRIYKEALESYEQILARGTFSGQMDELYYQMAKAHALTGENQRSIQRLQQLIGFYPDSELAPEARFRIAEAAFSAQDYGRAESGYRQLAIAGGDHKLATKARYMLGWSQFKQGPAAWNRAANTFMELLRQQLKLDSRPVTLPELVKDTVEDSFRILAVMAARSDNADTLAGWIADAPAAEHWHYLLYDRLADLHAFEQNYEQAVAVNRAFVSAYPEHSVTPDFIAQSVSFWQLAGAQNEARRERADYLARYKSETGYSTLNESQQTTWKAYSRFLADYFYASAAAAEKDARHGQARDNWVKAAGYYEGLAEHTDAAGNLHQLAGDAWLQAGQARQALMNFRLSAYEYRHEGSVEAGWAAITLLRDALASAAESNLKQALENLSQEEQRFSITFAQDPRLSGLRAELANRWYQLANYDRALAYASATLDAANAGAEERYAAWLVTARIKQGAGEFAAEERAWRQALALVAGEPELSSRADQEQPLKVRLATAIYRQGEQASDAGDVTRAVAHFQRVTGVLPGSEIAIRARFDAANTLLKDSRWLAAINELNRFRADFPAHALADDISAKLVMAYRESEQPVKAADELLAESERASDPWPLKLQAATLLHHAGTIEARDAIYREWLAIADAPQSASEHLQQQTMRQRLIRSGSEGDALRRRLVAQEDASQWHSEETLVWAGEAALKLGKDAAQEFADIELTHPLETALVRKQQTLEQAQRYFLQAESFAGDQLRSEVLYRRAELYRGLAADLMNSEVPSELNELEAMQYQMLLEEEAYPLEERALELHAKNHQRIAGQQGFDGWIARSLEALARMHPGRYSRELLWLGWNEEPKDDA